MKAAPQVCRRACLLAGASALAAAALGAHRGVLAQATDEQHLPAIDDLRPVAASIARFKAPLLILFSTPGCPFCRELRRNYLAPRSVEQARNSRPELLLREVDITSQRPMFDLAGTRITEALFAARFSVRIVPVVVLLDQTLQLLAEPLVGLDRSGFYEAYLAGAIDTARRRLLQTS